MTTPTSKKLGLAIFEKASANYNSERERLEREQSAEFPNVLVRIHIQAGFLYKITIMN